MDQPGNKLPILLMVSWTGKMNSSLSPFTPENLVVVVVVVVVFTLTDRASTIPSNIRGCQSGTWSQRGTKVNGSHHGDNLLLRPTGIQIATKSYATLQAMAPTNSKTVHQTSFTPYREQPRSTRIVVAYPRPAFSATNRTNTFQPVLINNSKFLKATHSTKIRKIEIPRSMVVEALSCWSRRASQHPAVTKPCASLKKPHKSCPFAAPCGPRRKKNDRGQRSAFPSETSRFALSILAHRGSALPWLVNDRAALRLRRISRDGFGRAVPRQPVPSILRLNLVHTQGIPPDLIPTMHGTWYMYIVYLYCALCYCSVSFYFVVFVLFSSCCFRVLVGVL